MSAEAMRQWRRSHGVPTKAATGLAQRAYTPCTYKQAHIRVTRHRGPARLYTCITCGAVAQQWAYVHGSEREMSDGIRTYSPHSDDYQPMCVRDHKLYDLEHIHNQEEAA